MEKGRSIIPNGAMSEESRKWMDLVLKVGGGKSRNTNPSRFIG
jgi:hypothetical protein